MSMPPPWFTNGCHRVTMTCSRSSALVLIELADGRCQRGTEHVLPEEVGRRGEVKGHGPCVDVDVAEAGADHQLVHRGWIVDGEHRRYERGHIRVEVFGEHVVELGEQRWRRSGHADGDSAARCDDAAHLSHRAALVGEELQPEGAQHGVERGIGKRQVIHARFVPLDDHALRRGRARDLEHARIPVDADDPATRPDDVLRHTGGDAGSAGDVEHPLTRSQLGRVDHRHGARSTDDRDEVLFVDLRRVPTVLVEGCRRGRGHEYLPLSVLGFRVRP